MKDKLIPPEQTTNHTILRYDGQAIRMLFEQYYTSLVLFAETYVHDKETAKDIVQEIFLYLIETQEDFHTITNLKAYLYQTTRNRCLKYLRHEAVKERYAQALPQKESDEFYFEQILETEVYRYLTKAIESLPEQCRKVFLLMLENKSNQEIADALSITVETVKSHKKTGKRLIYNQLKGVISVALLQYASALWG